MLSGWLRHLRLTATARTGLGPAVVVLAVATAICAATTFVLFVFAAFIWLADAYSPLTAALVLALAFLLLAGLAATGVVMAQRSTVRRARTALAARAHSPLLDPATLGIVLQIGRGIGLRRIVPLVAAGFLAAGFAREWLRDHPGEDGEDAEAAEPAE